MSDLRILFIARAYPPTLGGMETFALHLSEGLERHARVRRIIRRIGSFSFRLEPQTQIDEFLTIDFAEKKATAGGKQVTLTPIETKLLHILIGNARRTVRTDYLLGRIWPLDEVFEDTLRVHVHRLRQKIEPDASSPRYLITQRGTGYSFMQSAT